MPVKNVFLSALLIVLATLSFNAAAIVDIDGAQFRIRAVGSIEIAPDGSVHAHQFETKFTKEATQYLAQVISAWKFEPVLENGKAVIAKTELSLDLIAVRADPKTVRLSIENVVFGKHGQYMKSESEKAPPRYPESMLKSRVTADVRVAVKLNNEGGVQEAFSVQTSISVKGESRRAVRARKQFEEACIKAVRRWEFDIAALKQDAKFNYYLIIPIAFTISDGSSEAWNVTYPGPRLYGPWDRNFSADKTQAQLVADNKAYSYDGKIKLLSKI